MHSLPSPSPPQKMTLVRHFIVIFTTTNFESNLYSNITDAHICLQLYCIVTLPLHLPLASTFYAQQHIYYSTYMPCQFHLSVTRVYCIKTAERIIIIIILSPSDRRIILVFRHQGSLRKSDGFIPNGGARYKGGSSFWPICGYISERVIDRGMVTMED